MPLSSPVLLRAPMARARAQSPLHHRYSGRCTPIRNAHLPPTFLKFSTLSSSLCSSDSDVAFSMSVEGVLYIFTQNGYMKLLPKQSLIALNSTCKKVSKITSAVVSITLPFFFFIISSLIFFFSSSPLSSPPLLLSCSPALLLSCSPALLLSCSPALLLSCSPALLLSCSPALLLSCSPALLLSCSPALLLCSCFIPNLFWIWFLISYFSLFYFLKVIIYLASTLFSIRLNAKTRASSSTTPRGVWCAAVN